MPPRSKARRRKRRLKKMLVAVVALLLLAALAALVVLAVNLVKSAAGSPSVFASPTTTAAPREPQVVAKATVGNSGDILIHKPVMISAKQSAGVYDFSPMFRLIKPYVSKMDYAAINMEFGIGKGESDYWQREMLFRVPASLVDTVMDTGYTLGLCANNHVTNGSSLTLTEGTYTERNMDHIGLRGSGSDKRYLVKDVNGIKLGFVNYTYGTVTDPTSRINYFSVKNLPAFYSDLQTLMDAMKAEGAEAIVVYIHWGNEYQLKPASSQTEMAQKLCEMGVDVIVGGHPHKIQPLELITAENGNKTVCLYSMGNFLSNQTIEAMYGGKASNSRNFQDGGQCDIPDVSNRYKDSKWDQHWYNCNDNGHTEDGLLFQYTFSKYEDGTVLLTGVDVLPTWCYVKKKASGSGNSYTVIPLDKSVTDWGTAFGIAAEDVVFAERSYDRTMALCGDGMTAINNECNARVSAFVEAFKQAQLSPSTTEVATTE